LIDLLPGLSLIPVALGLLLYALRTYQWRLHNIHMRKSEGYHDPFGPSMLTVSSCFACCFLILSYSSCLPGLLLSLPSLPSSVVRPQLRLSRPGIVPMLLNLRALGQQATKIQACFCWPDTIKIVRKKSFIQFRT
jgi:hypothetical protein